MKTWALPLLIVYGAGLFLHALFYQIGGVEDVFWMGDLYWVGTGISVFGLAQTLEDQKKGRFIPVYFIGGIIRLFLGAGAVVLPLIWRGEPGYNHQALQFVGAYVFVLIAESAIAINWIKNK